MSDIAVFRKGTFNLPILEGTIKDYSERLIKISFKLADIYEERGEAEKAKEVLEKIIKIEPENISYLRRSDYYKNKGRLDEAERDRIKHTEITIERITKKLDSDTLDAPKADVLINRGKLYLSINQYDKAIVDFEMAKLTDEKVVLLADNLIDLAKRKRQENSEEPK